MKIEICPTTCTTVLVTVLIVVAGLLAALGIHEYSDRHKMAFENGYEQGSLPGRQGAFWLKAK